MNYYQAHKNKKPKIAKYSNFYTKKEKLETEKATVFFLNQIELLKIKSIENETNF